MIDIPESEQALARNRAQWFACEWFMETPMRLHMRAIDEGGAPEFHPEFVQHLEDSLIDARPKRRVDLADQPRRRVRRAFRTLREKAPREFDAAYCMVVLDEVGRHVRRGDEDSLRKQFESSLRSTTARLNQRAARRRAAGKKEPVFTDNDTLVLIVSALSKLTLWAG